MDETLEVVKREENLSYDLVHIILYFVERVKNYLALHWHNIPVRFIFWFISSEGWGDHGQAAEDDHREQKEEKGVVH